MEIPVYVTVEEVQRVCAQLGLSDWTNLGKEVPESEAGRIQELIGEEAAQIPLPAFKQGLEVELEHGRQFPSANVTNNHPLLTGMIVLAHLKETLDYYSRLEVAELEGDLLKALRRHDADKAARIYGRLAQARSALARLEAEAA